MKNLVKTLIATTAPAALLASGSSLFATSMPDTDSTAISRQDHTGNIHVCASDSSPTPTPASTPSPSPTPVPTPTPAPSPIFPPMATQGTRL
ncbi:MAG: hypothetical protein WCD79_13380 [Chthoniobacteraceae bacterium]